MKPLPPGLDPVTAGRFGLWLLGKRSHQRSLKRQAVVTRVSGGSCLNRFAGLSVPWTVETYPGTHRFLCGLLNVSVSSVKRWLHADEALPAKHAQRLALICRERSQSYNDLADELERVPAKRVGRLRRDDRGG